MLPFAAQDGMLGYVVTTNYYDPPVKFIPYLPHSLYGSQYSLCSDRTLLIINNLKGDN